MEVAGIACAGDGDRLIERAADLLAVPPRAQARYEAMDNATRTEGKLRILAASVARATARQPLVLLVEDVHWASPWVIACLAEWSRCVPQLRCALVMTSRREGDPVTPAWQREGLVRFDLPPLATDEALALASSYLAANPDVARRCVERAQGNPLFLTQLLRSDADGVAIPGTIQSVVLARLDRLPPSDKAALQAASVIGQRFGREVLRHLLADSRYDEANLVARDLIRRDGDDGRMMFVHALIRDGAYASLLHSVRRALHLRAADWYAGRDATLRAEHLDRAADPRAAAAYLEAARGEAAALRFDDALRLLRRGVELPATPDVGHDLARFEGDVARDTGDSAGSIAAFERALAHATTDARRSAAHLGIAAAHRATGDAAAGLAVLDRIEPLAAAAGLVREMAHAAYLRGCFEFARGDARASQAAQERALAHARAAGDAEGEAKALSGLADVLYADGRMRASFAAFGQCVALCDREGFARLALSNRCMLAIAHSYLEPANGALAELDRVRAVAGALRHRAAEVMADECAGWVYVIQGRFDEAIAPTERSLALARAIGSRRFVVFDLELLTFAYWHTGRHSDAAAALNEVVALSQDVGHRFIGVGVHGARALMAQSAAEVAAICAEGERSLEDGSPAHSHFWFRSQAIDASLAHGAWDGALRHATALEGFTRVEAVPWVEFQVARARALASAGRGQPDFAALRACRERGVALHLPGALPALDAALASSG